MSFIKTKQTKFDTLTDKELVAAILIEKKAALKRQLQEVLYNRYAEKIYFKCLSIVKSKETAKDLAHDIIIKIFTHLNKYSGKSEFYPWVAAVAYNHCITWLNKEKRIKVEDIDGHPSGIIVDDGGEGVAQKVLQEFQLNQLERLFDKIKEVEKIVLLMRYQDGLSVKEIAHILKVGESAVKMRLKRGRDHLAKLLKKENNE